jgi:hypothetical protein
MRDSGVGRRVSGVGRGFVVAGNDAAAGRDGRRDGRTAGAQARRVRTRPADRGSRAGGEAIDVSLRADCSEGRWRTGIRRMNRPESGHQEGASDTTETAGFVNGQT